MLVPGQRAHFAFVTYVLLLPAVLWAQDYRASEHMWARTAQLIAMYTLCGPIYGYYEFKALRSSSRALERLAQGANALVFADHTQWLVIHAMMGDSSAAGLACTYAGVLPVTSATMTALWFIVLASAVPWLFLLMK